MIVLATDWSTVWLMSGMGIGVVFTILVLLVFVLQIFSIVAKKTSTVAASTGNCACQVTPEEEEIAAVATAIYLYQESCHDCESGLLTISQPEYSMWHEELNERL